MQLKDGHGQIQIVIADQDVGIFYLTNLDDRLKKSIKIIIINLGGNFILDAEDMFKCE